MDLYLKRLVCAAGPVALLVAVMGLMLMVWPPGGGSGGGAAAGEPRLDEVGLVQPQPLRIGLIPERDIFQHRRRHRALADYLADRLGRPVELVTASSYQQVLYDFEERAVDAAFLGSLVTVLMVDRMVAEVVVKPQLKGGITTYRGVIFVSEGAPIHSTTDLAGRSIAMVRTTTGGNLFPIHEMARLGLFEQGDPPAIIWAGTHDDVILEVLVGRADAGAVKDLRLDDFEARHPGPRLRRLAHSQPVPENALLVRADLARELGPLLAEVMLQMDRHDAGRAALEAFGAERFLPCAVEEYRAIYEMIEGLGTHWERLAVEGPSPRRTPAEVRRGEDR